MSYNRLRPWMIGTAIVACGCVPAPRAGPVGVSTHFALAPASIEVPVTGTTPSESATNRLPVLEGPTTANGHIEPARAEGPRALPSEAIVPTSPPLAQGGGGSSGGHGGGSGGAARPSVPSTPAPVGLAQCAEVQPVAGVVATLAGGGYGYMDGPSESAQFKAPRAMTVDAEGNLFVADSGNRCIRKVAIDGAVTTYVGGPALADFVEPSGLAVALDGRMWVSDTSRHAVYVIDPGGPVALLAGGSGPGFADGLGPLAKFDDPRGLAVDDAGILYVADLNNHRIRAIDPDGNVTTLAGRDLAERQDGVGAAAGFVSPIAVAAHPDGGIVVADNGDHTIRRVTANGETSTVAGSGVAGDDDAVGILATFQSPWSVAADPNGTIYVVDGERASRIRRIGGDASVTTLVGAATSGYQNGSGSNARLAFAFSLTSDSCGRLFLSDGFSRIRQVQ